MVSVTVQKAGGDSIQPMGRTIGTAMRGSSSGDVVGTATASFSIMEGARPTLMNASARSYLLRLTIPCRGFASAAFWMILSRAGWSRHQLFALSQTIADLANTKIAQGYIPAPYHRHEAVANTTPEQHTMTECLQYSPDQHTGTGDAYKISSTSLSTTYTTSLLGSPNRSTGMGDTSRTSAATLRQSAE